MAATGLTMVVVVMMMAAATNGIMGTNKERVFLMEVLMERKVEEITQVQKPNLPELVNQLGLSTLYSAVVSASLGEALSAKGPFTLFGPTNEAFKAEEAWVAKLLKNVTALRQVLKYHVLANMAVFSKDIKDEATIVSLNGKPIRFNIYPVDTPKLVTAQCAPIDLKRKDLEASNGVLHVLNALMVPPYGNIAETVVRLRDFTTLVTALTKADLVKTLGGEGPFTVFAPTNAAFGKLDPKTLDYLLNNKTALQNVLLYHVLSRTYCRAGLVYYKDLKMLNNQTVQISGTGDELKVNNIPVLPIGVEGSVTNGVVHKIETVLIPPSLRGLP